MKTDLVQTLTITFEAHAQQTEDGVEYWLARDIQHLLGYSKWENFLNVVSKAKTACKVSGHKVSDHFPDVGKMVAQTSATDHFVGINKMVDYGHPLARFLQPRRHHLRRLPRQRRIHSTAQGNALGTCPPQESSALKGRHPPCLNPFPKFWFI